MAQSPLIGAIFMFAGNYAPTGYMLCNGQLLSVGQNSALYSILGTTYGGDGVSTFGLPDLRGRVPLHAGQGPGLGSYTLGGASGAENVTLLSTQMPVHNHSVGAVSGVGNQTSPASGLPATVAVTTSHPVPDFPAIAAPSAYSNAAVNTTMSQSMIQAAGGNQPHPNLQPYLCINFIIAVVGIFPSQ